MKREQYMAGKLLASTFAMIIMFAIIYGLHSFYTASFNLHDWPYGARFSCAFFGGFVSIATGIATFNLIKED